MYMLYCEELPQLVLTASCGCPALLVCTLAMVFKLLHYFGYVYVCTSPLNIVSEQV